MLAHPQTRSITLSHKNVLASVAMLQRDADCWCAVEEAGASAGSQAVKEAAGPEEKEGEGGGVGPISEEDVQEALQEKMSRVWGEGGDPYERKKLLRTMFADVYKKVTPYTSGPGCPCVGSTQSCTRTDVKVCGATSMPQPQPRSSTPRLVQSDGVKRLRVVFSRA